MSGQEKLLADAATQTSQTRITSRPSTDNREGLSLDDFPLSTNTNQGGNQAAGSPPTSEHIEDLSSYEDGEEGDLVYTKNDSGMSF
jgi:hypothetical protein